MPVLTKIEKSLNLVKYFIAGKVFRVRNDKPGFGGLPGRPSLFLLNNEQTMG